MTRRQIMFGAKDKFLSAQKLYDVGMVSKEELLKIAQLYWDASREWSCFG